MRGSGLWHSTRRGRSFLDPVPQLSRSFFTKGVLVRCSANVGSTRGAGATTRLSEQVSEPRRIPQQQTLGQPTCWCRRWVSVEEALSRAVRRRREKEDASDSLVAYQGRRRVVTRARDGSEVRIVGLPPGLTDAALYSPGVGRRRWCRPVQERRPDGGIGSRSSGHRGTPRSFWRPLDVIGSSKPFEVISVWLQTPVRDEPISACGPRETVASIARSGERLASRGRGS